MPRMFRIIRTKEIIMDKKKLQTQPWMMITNEWIELNKITIIYRN